jgi:hypothetical protein
MLNIKIKKQKKIFAYVHWLFFINEICERSNFKINKLTSFNFRIPEYPHLISSEYKSNLLTEHHR